MKNHSRNTRGPGAWVLGGVASLLMCVSAFGQYVATQSTSISIPDHGDGNPYPSKIDLTKSNIVGVIEKVTVTLSSLTHPSAPDLSMLLVGPNGNAVVLMSGSGGNPSGSAALNSATLIFTDDSKTALPVSSPLVSGTSYKPTDNLGYPPNTFDSPAPASPYANTLTSAFGGANPNGVWSLFVLDTTPGPSTTLTPALGSWSLNLFTTPTVAVQTNSSTLATNIFGSNALTTFVNQDGSVVVNLTVGSSSASAGSLTVSGVTNNLVTNSTYFAYGGSGANRTITISPNPHTYGTNTLTINVGDGVGSVSTNITLAVSHVDQVPIISLSTNTLTTVAGQMTTNLIIASLGSLDPAFHPTNSLTLVALSSNPSVVSPSSVFFTTLDAGGSQRAVSVVPTGAGNGTATITVQVGNGAKTNSSTFTITVLPIVTPMVANTSVIALTSSGTTNSTITVPANTISGLVGNLVVSLSGLDLPSGSGSPNIITLTAPNGQAVQLINDTQSGFRHYGQVLVADGASGNLPSNDNLTNAITIAPNNALGNNLIGVNPNGTWTLSINSPNAASATPAQLLNGWTLIITVAPVVGTVNPNPVLGNEETTLTANFTVTSAVSTVTNVTGIIPGNPGLATFTGAINGNNATLTIVGNFNQFGTNTVQAVATDKNGFMGTNTFTLGLAFVDHPPQISFINRQVVAAGDVLSGVNFTVTDVDTPINQVTLSVSSDNQKLIPNSSIVITPLGTGTGNSTNYTLTIFPAGTASGSANITITANDNMNAGGGPKTGSTTFNVFVQAANFPLFAFTGGISINSSAPGVPYPATNVVSGLIGSVEKVKVTLFGLSAPTPENVQVLLVGPNGQTSTLLMANSGAGGPVSAATVVFDDSASSGLPQSGVITSGTFQPTQHGFGSSLPAPAPGTPYGTGLSVFANSNPNGNWLLYVNDNGSASKGAIANGWTLSIQTAPSVPAIKDQYTTVNLATNISVIVGDNQPGANLTVTAVPSNPNLIQTPIGVTISGANAILHVVPQPYAFGTNTITVTVKDPDGNQAQNSFNMGVAFAAQPPLFTSVPADQTVAAATQLGPLPFKIFSPQGSALTVSASSLDNPGLIPNVSVSPDTGNNVGNTNAYTLTLIPAGVLTGTGTVTIAANDAGGLKASASFKVVVTPSLAFANTNFISIPQGPITPGQLQQGAATPYPSIIAVKGIGGVISDVKATLVNLNHGHPSDLDILLVGPDNKTAVMLMAHAGGSFPASGLRINFDDDSPNGPAPQNNALVSESYTVSDYSGGIVLPAPAPVRPYGTDLAAFNGLNPNGNWQLFVLDDTFPTGGSIDNGWVLAIQTAPAIAGIGPQTTPENKPLQVALSLSTASTDPTNLIVSVVTSSNSIPDLVDPTNLVVTGTGANLTLTITPTTNLPSAFNVYASPPLSLTNLSATNIIIVTAADPINDLTNSTKFPLTVTYVNQSPIISTVVKTNAYYVDENTFTTISYNYLDVDSTNYLTNIVATSSNQGLLANTNIVVTLTGAQGGNTRVDPGSNAVVVVKVTPTQNTHGSLTLTLTGTDGNTTTTNQVTLNINHIWQQPTISSIATQPAIVGSSTTNIAFTVGSVEVPANNLLVYATSDAPSLVPNSPANIVLGGSGANRTIQLFPIGSSGGSADITVFVTDLSITNANSTNSTTFVLNAQTVLNTFANVAPITTSGAGTANIYPSTIDLTAGTLQGPTFKVDVVLPSFSHSSPANLDILLEEDGVDTKTNAVVLMSGAGGSTSVSNLRLQFDDAGSVLPASALTSGTYAPNNYTKGLILPAPAPTNGIWKATLTSAFVGLNPNGVWKLFVNDRGSGDSGNIAQGWQLVIETAPTVVPASVTPPLVVLENSTNTITLNLGDMTVDVTNLTVSATTDNQVLLPNRNITFSSITSLKNTGPSGSYIGTVQATIVPAFLQSGSNNVTFTVTRSDGAASSYILPVKVTPINVPPTISRLGPVSMPENSISNITVIISDVDTPQSGLSVLATSDNQTLIPSTSVVFAGTGTNHLIGLPGNNGPNSSILTLQLSPASFQQGSANITLTVTDPLPAGTNIVSSTFPLTVTPVVFPPYFITAPGNQTVAAGGTLANIPYAVGSPTPFISATSLTNRITSSDKTLVDPAKVTFTQDASGTNRTVTIIAESNTNGGTAVITLTIVEPISNATASTNFNVTVRPARVLNYANTGLINIIDNSPGAPYPSQIAVSGLVGPISKVTATLKGFTHSFASDVGVLLVGPTGQKIALMNNDATGRPGPTNINLAFDQAAASTIPLTVPLLSGSYQPLDNSGGRVFAAPAPGPAYTNTLNAFTNSNPNGTWSLYVEDFVLGDFGAISNGWSLGITTLPVISGLTDVTNNENTAAVEKFTVLDDNTNNQSFTFTATSDNQSVVTNGGVVITGSGRNYVVTVNPLANVFGSANITINMLNGDGQTVSQSFKVTFLKVLIPPTIAPIADVAISAGTGASVPLVYSSPGYNQSQLTVTFQSSNTNLVPVGNMKLVGTNMLISPVGVQQGTATLTVVVSNPDNLTTNTSFKLTVGPNLKPVFAQSQSITINDNAAATPYPSTLTVSGVQGTITDITATLVGLGHTFPSDVSVLLVGPQGQAVVLMSRAGGSVAITNTRITFDDAAASVVPQFTLITDGTYQPTDYKASDTFFPPVPSAPYSHALSAFDGTNPNGTWSLYVQDDVPQNSGVITGGWILTITTTAQGAPPVVLPIPAQTAFANRVASTLKVNFSVNPGPTAPTNLTTSATADNTNLVTAITTSSAGNNTNFTASIVIAATNLGVAHITVVANDQFGSGTNTFTLTVSQPAAPVLAAIGPQTTPVNISTNVTLGLTSANTPLTNLLITATDTNKALLKNVTFAINGSTVVASLNVVSNMVGFDFVTINVNDGFVNVAQSFPLTVTPIGAITMAPIPAQNTSSNVPAKVVLSVTSPSTAVTNLTFKGTSTNATLVSSITFAYNGANVVATVNLVANKIGTDFVTISATDGFSTAVQSFVLNVTGATISGPATLKISKLNNQLTVVLTGTANGNYAVQSSTNNFSTWTTVTNVTADGTGKFTYTAPISAAVKTEFIRAQSH